ncbi:MAG: transcriptional repressor [Gammaproteobacteria bacterium]|nr:transcriptional repressor [Gammaproteobacteria bacterium]
MSKRASTKEAAFPRSGHDHEACVTAALQRAETVCAEHGVRLTPLRRRVLEIVWASHRPVGAYAILETLGQEGFSPAPPTVYRSLDFLQEQGLVHRIASLNAFIGCEQPGHAGSGQFLICHDCGTAVELTDPAIEQAIRASAEKRQFTAEMHNVEVSGVCPNCRD